MDDNMKRLLIVAALLIARPVFAQNLDAMAADLRLERAKYPTPMTRETVATMLNAVAWKHRAEGWGLLRKPAGNNCTLGSVPIACDIFIYAPTRRHYDALSFDNDTGEIVAGLTIPFGDSGPCDPNVSGCDMARFVAPVDPGGAAPGPPPSPNPPPASTFDPTPILDRLSSLEQQLADVKGEARAQRDALNALDQRTQAHETRLQSLESRPIPTSCSVPYLGCRLR